MLWTAFRGPTSELATGPKKSAICDFGPSRRNLTTAGVRSSAEMEVGPEIRRTATEIQPMGVVDRRFSMGNVPTPKPIGAVAQLGERCVRNAEVRGSNPLGSTQYHRHKDFAEVLANSCSCSSALSVPPAPRQGKHGAHSPAVTSCNDHPRVD